MRMVTLVVLAGGMARAATTLAAQQEPSPPPRMFTATAYDAARERLVLFGGQSSASAMLEDTWEWDGARWIRAAPPRSPPARAGHAMAYDPVRRRVVLVGGYSGGQMLLQDTWEWDGRTWSAATGPQPEGRVGHQFVWVPQRGRLVLLFGQDERGPRGDLWEWDGRQWSTLVAQGERAFDPSSAEAVRLRAYQAAMRSDLRNLVTAQEVHYADHATYTTSFAALNYTASTGVTVQILEATATGWSGTATHERAPGARCGIYVGTARRPFAEVEEEGVPACVGAPQSQGR
jgi:hypothetical protein